ncbi:hypothetical protein L1049_019483 [Liquidambar formosana]|uniref:DUF21 domain-containing protein n=1 Tax=Liquidambar formosana TaxID=63359 RepID=A0AAP0XA64_LIQFO
MTPISETFSLDINSKLNEETMSLVLSKGHSRIPIYSGKQTNIIGLILVKNLIKCHPEDEIPIRNLTIRRIPSDTESQSPTLKNVMERDRDIRLQVKKLEQGDENILNEDLDSLPNLDEEVIGIITMEDVIEELLQEEILDETDEYVDVHNKIKINMLSSRRSSPRRSPGAPSASHLHWRTPEASPLSSYHQTPVTSYNHTPVLRSPISPYIPSPFIRPALSASPGQPIPNSPAGVAGPGYSSPSSRWVSRKSYEKLRQPGGS